MVFNSILVGVVVLNNTWILEPHHLPIFVPFSLVATFLLVSICSHQHRGAIWFLSSMNMKVLSINYSRNGIIISYLLPRKVLLHCFSVNIIFPVPPFYYLRR